MVQNYFMSEYIRKIFFYDCAIDNNFIYFPLANYNALCKANLLSGKCEIIDMFPDEDNSPLLYCGIYKVDNLLLFGVSRGKNRILIYDICKKIFYKINIEGIEKKWLEFNGNQVVNYNGKLYIFTFGLVVININLKDLKATYKSYTDKRLLDDEIGQIKCIKDKVYVPMKNQNYIYSFDLVNETFEKYYINCDINGIATLEYDGINFWMTGKNRGIYKWNKEKNEINKYDFFPANLKKIIDCEYNWFSDSVYYKSSIFFIPAFANMIIEFDLRNNTIYEIQISNEEESEESIYQDGRFFWQKYLNAKRKNDKLLLMSSKRKCIYLLDMNSHEYKEVELQYCQNLLIRKKMLGLSNLKEEMFLNGIRDYIELIIGCGDELS
ncbi:MAG: hypothetical protein DBY13_01045 [Lachnospiraceae bacterium]|nr:MAG: hypothetical protein DBY13_01045 [Lachnospiraceae bacterium]